MRNFETEGIEMYESEKRNVSDLGNICNKRNQTGCAGVALYGISPNSWRKHNSPYCSSGQSKSHTGNCKSEVELKIVNMLIVEEKINLKSTKWLTYYYSG